MMLDHTKKNIINLQDKIIDVQTRQISDLKFDNDLYRLALKVVDEKEAESKDKP